MTSSLELRLESLSRLVAALPLTSETLRQCIFGCMSILTWPMARDTSLPRHLDHHKELRIFCATSTEGTKFAEKIIVGTPGEGYVGYDKETGEVVRRGLSSRIC